jgi:hypothetical protein
MLKKSLHCCSAVALTFLLAVSLYSQTPSANSSAKKNVDHTSAQPSELFAGINFTNDQKAKIDQIRQDIKHRMDVVAKDEKLNPDQKSSMLDGYWRMEQRQIFAELTPEQQREVRSKAKHAAEQDKKKAFPPNRNMKVGDQP